MTSTFGMTSTFFIAHIFCHDISVMADGCTLLSSTKNSGSHSNDWNFKEILEQKASSNLVYQDKRISWIGSYELLRNFVECVVKLNGKWTSPGGSAKKFTCCSMDLSITWYPGKQNSLILHGEESLAVTEMLINVCKLLTNGECTEGTKLSSNGSGGLLVNVRESDSVSANAVNSINSRETAMTPTVEVLAEIPTSSNTRASNIMQGLQNVCRCDVLAADLEGVKLDIVIMQNDIEPKIHAANSNSIRDKDEITQLRHELFCEKEKCRRLENDLSILVIGRDKEINEVNNTIVSLENKLKASEALNESLKEIIMCMNSERVHKSMHMENTSGIIKPESGDQSRLNQPDNYNYNGPEVNYFDPVLENEIKDNANAIRLSEMDNEPSTPLTMHPQLEKHSRNSEKGLNHQNMKLMQKAVLKQGRSLDSKRPT